MPYGSTSQVGKGKEGLPEAAKKIYMSAFNAAYKQYNKNESKASAIAWAAVKRKFKKNAEGKWVAKDAAEITDSFEFEEPAIFDAAQAVTSKEGYLLATPRIARTGIQKYFGFELGDTDNPYKEYSVYRPEEEVFDKAALASLAYKPVTMDHPPVMINSENWNKYSKGQLSGEVVRDGDFVRFSLAVMAQDAVKSVRDGKAQLSVGYTSELVFDSGETSEGEHYDAVQRNIRANHVAIVKNARGGPLLRIGDEDVQEDIRRAQDNQPDRQKRRKRMLIQIDGIGVNFEDDRDAQLVQRHIKTLTDKLDAQRTQHGQEKKQLDDQVTQLTTQVTTLTKSVETKDAEIATVKTQLDQAKLKPEQLDAMVTARLDSVAKARAVLGDKLVIKDKTDADIRRQVVDSKLGDLAKGWSDDQITASFNTLTADVKIGDNQNRGGGNDLEAAARAFGGRTAATDDDNRTKAYDGYLERLEGAWKEPIGRKPARRSEEPATF